MVFKKRHQEFCFNEICFWNVSCQVRLGNTGKQEKIHKNVLNKIVKVFISTAKRKWKTLVRRKWLPDFKDENRGDIQCLKKGPKFLRVVKNDLNYVHMKRDFEEQHLETKIHPKLKFYMFVNKVWKIKKQTLMHKKLIAN